MYLPAPRHLGDGVGVSQEKLEREHFSSSCIRKTCNLIDTSKHPPFRSKYKERTARPTISPHAGFRDAAEWHPPQTIQLHEQEISHGHHQ